MLVLICEDPYIEYNTGLITSGVDDGYIRIKPAEVPYVDELLKLNIRLC